MRLLTLAGLAVALGLMFASEATAATCTDTFTGPSGKQWSEAANWSTGKKPGPSDVACWEPGKTVLATEPENFGGGEVGSIQGGALVVGRRNGFFIFGPGESTLSGSLTLEEQADLKDVGGGTRVFRIDGAITDSPAKLEGESGGGIELVQGPGTTLTIGGTSQVEVHPGSSISTESPITIENAEFNASGPVTTTSTITFGPGISIDGSGGDHATFTAAGVMPNSGPEYGFGGDTLLLTGGETTVAAGTKLESGPVELEGGILRDDGAIGASTNIFDETTPAPVTLTGGTLTGAGTVAGPLNVTAGTVAPGPHGKLMVSGAYDQEGGSLAFGIAGATPGSGFDQLLLSAGAQFAGTLEATDEQGFAPPEGETFKVVAGASLRSGTFASFGGASAGLYTPEYQPDGLALKAHLPLAAPATATTVTATPVTATPGLASRAGDIAALLHGCSSSPLVLNDVYIHGGRVLLRGSSSAEFAGKTVNILFNEKKTVAHAKVTADGSFTTTAPLPPKKVRDALTTRYSAEIDKLRSLHLKLTRRLQLEPPTSSGDTVTLKGHIELPLTKPVAPVIVEQELECGKTTTAETFTPTRSGRFDVTLRVPAAAKAAIYRLKTKVAANVHATRHGFTTYSLPLPVVIG